MKQNSYQRTINRLYREQVTRKLNFLIVSAVGCGTIFAQKLKEEGHNVKMYIKDSSCKDVFDGMVDKVDNWERELDWADIVIVDDNDMGKIQDKIRAKGHSVIGGSDYSIDLENNRLFQMEEMIKLGMNVPPYREFNSFKEAKQYVKDRPDTYVIKPDGLKMQNAKWMTYVGKEKDGHDVIEMLEIIEKHWQGTVKILLQKKIIGSEVACGCYFDGEKFVEPVEVNFEYKKMCNGDLGPTTGEMGTYVLFTPFNKLFSEFIKPFEARLRETNFVGDFDINFILTEDGELYPLEITARFGYPSSSIHFMNMKEPLSQFLVSLSKKTGEGFTPKAPHCVGVVIVCPPFPYESKELFDAYNSNLDIKLNGATNVVMNDVKVEEGKLKPAGDVGYLFTVVGYGNAPEEAIKMAYDNIKKIKYPNIFYRTDIGKNIQEKIDKLKKWGLIE